MDALHGEFRRKSGAVVFSFLLSTEKKLEVWNSRHSSRKVHRSGVPRWRALHGYCAARACMVLSTGKYACAYRAAVLDVEVVQKIGVERLLELPVLDAIPDQCCRRGAIAGMVVEICVCPRRSAAAGRWCSACPMRGGRESRACAGQRQAVALLARGGRTAPAAVAQRGVRVHVRRVMSVPMASRQSTRRKAKTAWPSTSRFERSTRIATKSA